MKIRQFNGYLAVPKSIDLDTSIQGLVGQLDSYGLPKPALDRFTSDLISCDTKGELGSAVKRLRSEIDKFYKGGVWVSIGGESKFMYPNEIVEEYKKANDEYSKAVSEVKGKYEDKRLKKARENRNQAFQNVNAAIETTASSVVKFGSGMLSGNPDQMIDAGLNALGDILKILSKTIASSILKIAKTYDKVRNGDEFSKDELKELKAIEKKSIEIHTAAPNEFPDFDTYVTPMSEDDYEEIKEEQDSIAQDNFDEVGEITDWESAFKYGKAKLKQIHGFKYNEAKATEVLEGLKSKYPDTPQCVIGALKYGGFHKKDTDKNSRFVASTGYLGVVPENAVKVDLPIRKISQIKNAQHKKLILDYFDFIASKLSEYNEAARSKFTGDASKFKETKYLICSVICEVFGMHSNPSDLTICYGFYSLIGTFTQHVWINLSGISYDLRCLWEDLNNLPKFDYSQLMESFEVPYVPNSHYEWDLHHTNFLDIAKNNIKYVNSRFMELNSKRHSGVLKKGTDENSRLMNSDTISVNDWEFDLSDCKEVEIPIKSLEEYDYPPITNILKRYFDSINEFKPDCVWICEKFIADHKLIDSYVVYGMYNPYNQGVYTLYAVVELGGTYFDLKSMYERYKGQEIVPYSKFFKYRSLSRINLLELKKNMKIRSRKLNSSNEFTIHGVKFSKDNCHPRDFIAKTAFNEIPSELNYQLKIEKALRNMGPNLSSIQMCEEFAMKYDRDAMVEYGLYSPNGDGNYIPYAVVVCYQPNGNIFCCDLKSVYDEMNGGKPHKWSGDFREWKSSDDWTLSQYKKFISNNSVYRGRNSKIADKWIEVEDILLLRNPDMTDDQLNKAINEIEVESKGDFNKAKRLAAESNFKLNSRRFRNSIDWSDAKAGTGGPGYTDIVAIVKNVDFIKNDDWEDDIKKYIVGFIQPPEDFDGPYPLMSEFDKPSNDKVKNAGYYPGDEPNWFELNGYVIDDFITEKTLTEFNKKYPKMAFKMEQGPDGILK